MYEMKLRNEEEERQMIKEQKSLLMQGYAEKKTSIDDDADREIEDYKRKYEIKVRQVVCVWVRVFVVVVCVC